MIESGAHDRFLIWKEIIEIQNNLLLNSGYGGTVLMYFKIY